MEHHSVVVCVTDQQSCVRLIHAGSQLAEEKSCDLHVLSVVPASNPPRSRGDALEFLFSASRAANAEMSVFYNDDPINTTLNFLEAKNASDLVLGIGPDRADGFTRTIFEKCQAEIHIIGKNGEHYSPSEAAV